VDAGLTTSSALITAEPNRTPLAGRSPFSAAASRKRSRFRDHFPSTVAR
jgi:hypothetical protein